MLLNPKFSVSAPPGLAKRYWRIYATDTNFTGSSGADAVALAEVTWVDRFGASVPKPGTVVVTSDSQFSGTYAAGKAYDGNNSTFWSGYGPAVPGWIAFDFGSGAEFDFREVSMRARPDSFYDQAPSDFDIQYSDDGISWVTYWSKSSVTWASGLEQTFYM